VIATNVMPMPRAHPDALRQVVCVRCDQHFLADQDTRYSARQAGWVHVRCPAATEFAIGPGREAERVSWSVLRLPSPAPPPHLMGSIEVRLLSAIVDAEVDRPGDSCLSPQPVPDHVPTRERGEYPPGTTMRCGECPACRRWRHVSVAAVVTEIERYRHGRRLQLADTWTSLPDWVRGVTARPREERIKALLGDWVRGPKADGGGVFRPAELVPERWRLTEDEARVYDWSLDGWSIDAIQREATAPRLRKHRELWVSADHVQALLDLAEAKVRGMFGVA
jgi:hypothetical protein